MYSLFEGKCMKLIFVLFSIFLFLNNCLYRDVKTPFALNKGTIYQLTTDDYQILGKVEAEGVIKDYLFMVSIGGNGFTVLEQKAKAMGADDIMNYSFDIEQYGIFIFYNVYTWKARGIAIKYRDKAIK